MPTSVHTVGNTEATGVTIPADPQRTVLIICNLDTTAGTDFLYVSDEKGQVAITGITVNPIGGTLTLRRTDGEEPEKTFYMVAVTAGCPVRVMELYGEPSIIVETKPEEISPQEPERPRDAPIMPKERWIDAGYR